MILPNLLRIHEMLCRAGGVDTASNLRDGLTTDFRRLLCLLPFRHCRGHVGTNAATACGMNAALCPLASSHEGTSCKMTP